MAADTIKVGVLHSLSGTMAISETTLKDTVMMLVDDLNKQGGLLGKKVEAVVVDPASNWPLFAEKARELKLPGEYGALVTEVEEDSPAAKAGLQEDDVILKFDGERVRSASSSAPSNQTDRLRVIAILHP